MGERRYFAKHDNTHRIIGYNKRHNKQKFFDSVEGVQEMLRDITVNQGVPLDEENISIYSCEVETADLGLD